MRNPLRVRFVRDVAMTGGTQATQAASAMIAGILVARVLGPEAKGELSVLTALASIAVLLVSLGVHHSGVYFLGRFKSDRAAVVSNNALVGIAGGVVTGVALGVTGVVFHEQLLHGIAISLFLVFLLFVPCNYFNEFGRRVMLGAGRVGIYNLPDLFSGGGLIFGTSAALLIFGSKLVPLVVLRVVVELAISAFLFVQIGRLIGYRFKPSWPVLRRQMRYGMRNYASSLLWIFLVQSDLVLCNHFLGNKPTGVYSVAVSLGLPITMLGTVVGTIIFQRVSADESATSRVAKTNRAIRVLVPILTVAVAALAVCASWIVPLIYGSKFDAASEALVLLLPGLFALCIELVIMNFLAGNGSPPIVYIAPLIGLIVNLGANFYVIPRYGINGAATTSSVGYAIVLALALGYYLRSTGSRLRELLMPRLADVGLARAVAQGTSH